MKCVSPSQVLSLCTLWNKTSPRGSTLQLPQVTPGAVNGQWAETPKWKIWGMSVHGASEKPDILPGAVQGCVCAWAIPGETPISQRRLTPRLCSGGGEAKAEAHTDGARTTCPSPQATPRQRAEDPSVHGIEGNLSYP